MAAPTFVAEAETVWNTTTSPKTTGSLSVQTGDVLLDCIADENFTTAENYTTTNSGTAQTWTELRPTLTNNGDCSVQIHYAVSTVTASMTVTATRTAGDAGDMFGHNVLQYRDSDGIGSTANSGTAQSVSITVSEGSSIVAIVGDWSAASWGASTRPWIATGGLPTPTEMSYFQSGADYTTGIARWDNVPAGTYTVGLTGLSGTFCIQAIEVLGTAGGGTPVDGTAAGSFGFTATVAGVPRPLGVAASSLGFTGSAQGVARALGEALAALGGAFTASGVDRALGQAVAAFVGAFTASGSVGSLPVTGQASSSFGFTGSAAGVDRARGVAVEVYGFTSAALGVDRALGAAVVAYVFTGSSTGVARPRGQATTSFGFTGTATGFAGTPPVTGQAAASFGGSFAAAGVDRALGLAATAFGGGFAAVGVDRARGLAVASFGGTFTAAGDVLTIVTGSASTALGFVGVVIVFRSPTPAERVLVVEAESRVFIVGAESRVDVVPPRTEQP